MNHSNDLAFRIYQSLLDGIGDAVRLGDFDRYMPFFQLPHVLETFEKRTVIETPEVMEAMFACMQGRMRELNVRELTRSCTVAQFDGPDTIRGCHDTRLIDRDGTLRDAYSALSTLRLINGQWLVAVGQYAEDTASIPSLSQRVYSEQLATAAAAQ